MGRMRARKKPHPVKDAAGVWEEVGLVSIESAVRADSPRVNRWGWGGADSALDYQRFVYGSLGRLERVGGYGAEVAFGTVNVKGLHRVRH